jgi:RNA polymerase sigma-70 factor, ECF subfamily
MQSFSQPVSDKHQAHAGEDDDVSLALNLPSGCEDCFGLIFRRYYKLVFSIAWKILRDRSDAEDVVQEVFLTIFQGRNRYDSSRGSVSAWIGHFAQFRALSKRRSLRLRQFVEFEDESLSDLDKDRIEQVPNMMERTAIVAQCLETLNPRQRRAIELVHFDGFTLLETAGHLNESLANTRNLYYRGMQSLRTYLYPTNKIRGAVSEPQRTKGPSFEEARDLSVGTKS